MDQFSEILSQGIARLGLTQGQAAKLIGIQLRTLNNYINGSREPDIETIKLIGEKLGIKEDIGRFFMEQNVPHETQKAVKQEENSNKYADELIAVLKEQNEFLRRNFEVSLQSIHQISVAQLVHLKALEWYQADRASGGDPEKTDSELMRMGSKIAELSGAGAKEGNPVRS